MTTEDHGADDEFIRKNPAMFLGTGTSPNIYEFASLLVCDALVLGSKKVLVETIDDWIVVSSDFDWIREGLPNTSVKDAVRKIWRLNGHKLNSTRASSLVCAYVKDVVTIGEDGYLLIQGTAPISEKWGSLSKLDTGIRRKFLFKDLTQM
jgi:hypothetical protein